MSQSPIQQAIKQICLEKNLNEEQVLRTIEVALAAAYRKDFGNKMQNIITEFNPEDGSVRVYDVKTVVDDVPEEELAEAVAEVSTLSPAMEASAARESSFVSADGEDAVKKFNPKTEIQLTDAHVIDKEYKIGDEIVTELPVPGEFGRMAAQTAKQVIIQKLREEERQSIYERYKEVEHEVINGIVQRREGRNVLVDLDHATAVMLPEDQLPRERYNIGNRLKFYLRTVEVATRGPQLIVSRTHPELVKKIFDLEIPEIASHTIEIKNVSREAGSRSKIAIYTEDENIDPIGSCVGQRGTRIQTIISELGGEKVDIILWDEDATKFITNALSPAKVIAVELLDDNKAVVTVKEDQLSLAIGRGGQNVRLASKLTGWNIDIISTSGKTTEEELAESEAAAESGAAAEDGDQSGVASADIENKSNDAAAESLENSDSDSTAAVDENENQAAEESTETLPEDAAPEKSE